MRILFLIARQYNLLYQTKLLKGKGYDNKSIASKLGLSPFIAGKYVTQASRFGKGNTQKKSGTVRGSGRKCKNRQDGGQSERRAFDRTVQQ